MKDTIESLVVNSIRRLGYVAPVVILSGCVLFFNASLLRNKVISESIKYNLQYILITNRIPNSKGSFVVAVTIINAGTKSLSGIVGHVSQIGLEFFPKSHEEDVEWIVAHRNAGTFKIKNKLLPGERRHIEFTAKVGDPSMMKYKSDIERSLNSVITSEQARGAEVESEKEYNVYVVKRLSKALFKTNIVLVQYLVLPYIGIFLIIKTMKYIISFAKNKMEYLRGGS